MIKRVKREWGHLAGREKGEEERERDREQKGKGKGQGQEETPAAGSVSQQGLKELRK